MWTVRLKDMPKSGHTAVSINNKVYSIGTYRTGQPINVSVFHPTSNRWDLVQTQSLPDGGPKKRAGFTIVAYEECAYLWGGADDDDEDDAVYRLDINTMTWSRPQVSGEVPTLVSSHSACVVGGCMYIFGGLPRESSQYVHFLDLGAMRWHRIRTAGEAPRCPIHHRASAIGTRMYVWGGHVSGARGDESDSSVYYLETATATWMRPHVEGATPEGRSRYSSFVYNEEMYIMGGYHWRDYRELKDIHKYNPDKSCWTLVKPRGSGPCFGTISGCSVIGHRVLVFGATVQIVSRDEPIEPLGAFHVGYLMHVHVLDFAPTLETLCHVALLQARLDYGSLPLILRNKISATTTDDNCSFPS